MSNILESPDTIAIAAANDKSIFSEEGRHLKKRIELRKKLNAKKALEASSKVKTDAEIEAEKKVMEENLKSAAEKIKAMETPEEAPKEKIKIGKKMVLQTDAKLSVAETARIQARCAAGKTGKLKAYVKEDGVKRVITKDEVSNDQVVVFSNCKNSEYVLDAETVKVFIDHCTDCVFLLNGRILTSVVEVEYCEQNNIVCDTKIGTLQIEQCKKMNVVITKKEYFNNYLIWAGCFLLQIKIADDIMRCDFALYKQFDKTINIERTQFKVWYDAKGKLISDKIIRLANGFPTTKKEDDEFQRREEANLAILAERVGITINRKKEDIGGRVKPNETCPCGSGKKYKKCCRT